MKAAWPVALGTVALGTVALGAVACLMVPGISLMLVITPGAVLAGAIGGVTGGLAAFSGAMVVIWYGLLGWPRTRQRRCSCPGYW